MKTKKSVGLIILLIIYLLATGVGIGVFYVCDTFTNMHFILSALLADVAATLFVWMTGLIFKTMSVYDPYWSVQTIIIYILLLVKFNNWNLGTILLLIPLGIYTIRLTGNFIYTFTNLGYIDWRYKMLKEKSGKLYFLLSLAGICMFPTLVVYSASLPAFFFAESGEFHPLILIGIILMLGSIALELVSDMQMHTFRKNRTSKDEVINVGLWKYSRHPNYLGEISFWFALYFVYFVLNISMWYLFAGALINLVMFLIISIPMEEKHMLQYKPNLKDYIASTSMLLILPKRKTK
jgi:steroid 5-alpha reductase family enzyme